MRDARHVARSCNRTAPAGPTRRAVSRLTLASRLVLATVAGVSCAPDEIVHSRTDAALTRTGARTEALTRTQHVRVESLSDGHVVRGSNATLKRQSAGLSVWVHTRELHPSESVDVFWAIFNNPAACTHQNPLTGAPCSPPDLFIEETRASLHYVATLTADAHGKLRYSASLTTRSTAGCVSDPFPCHTLTNPFGAEVHSPIFVPNGGAGRQAAQFFAR
jgi:hypothetical protein